MEKVYSEATPLERLRSNRIPSARVVTYAQQKRAALPTAHDKGDSPGSGVAVVMDPSSIQPHVEDRLLSRDERIDNAQRLDPFKIARVMSCQS